MNTCTSMPARRERVIALHCSGADGGQWRSLAQALGPAFELLAPEHYGCESVGPWPGIHRFTLADEAKRTFALIDSSDRPVHLVGHSYGGGVALRVALERPGRVASLSLYEPSAFHLLREIGMTGTAAFAEIQAVAQQTVDGMATGDYRGAARKFVDYWGGAGSWSAMRPSAQEALTRWLPKAPLDFTALMNEPIPLTAYRRLPMPVLVMHGQHAPAPTRLITEILADALPDIELALVAGAGHMGPLTHSGIVNQAIVQHIAEASAPLNRASAA